MKALRKKYPQITTVVLNVNDKKTSMVLGERDIVIYGKDISGIRSADVHSAFLRSLLSGKSCTDRNSV